MGVWSLELLVSNCWFMVHGSWFMVKGLWFMVTGSEFGVGSLELLVSKCWFMVTVTVIGYWLLVIGDTTTVLAGLDRPSI